jgi:3-deoxy-7-phosphoheptulonate synthase
MFFLEFRLTPDVETLDALEDNAEQVGATFSRYPSPWERLARVDGPPVSLESLRDRWRLLPSVARILDLNAETPLVSRARHGRTRPVALTDGCAFGGDEFVVVAGPCAVERRDQVLETAQRTAAAGARGFRAGAHKPRTSPWEFQGLGQEGVELLAWAGRAAGLPVITEALDPAHVEPMIPWVDMFQVGARNMQNFPLLRALGQQPRPVLLKRGAGNTLREWLAAAEYLVKEGNEDVVLCERGIRTFETANRYTLDLATALLARQQSWLPVVIDPSHATGRPSLIPAMAAASLAAGFDGLLVEVHPRPAEALSDGPQALRPAEFDTLMDTLRAIAPPLGRTVAARADAPPIERNA